ncbi:MAG TPA: class IV adenylate cyclase [Candidatus Binataceae bacterium]|nr:class IV adenylate cyclase [Candidatus Binataceae bacterium]
MRNLEAKFRLADLARARTRAEAIGFVYSATLIQRDSFFAVSHGKLKLREEADGAVLIHYQREDARGFELSNYTIVRLTEPAPTRAMLESALGVIAEVRKRRTLLLRENIRFHLDEVEQLGEFGEIEVVLSAEDDATAGHAALNAILDALEVRTADLIGVSYFELIGRTRPPPG